MVWTELDVNGNWVGNTAGTQGECVQESEAQHRRSIYTNPPSGGTGGGGGGGGGTDHPSGPATYNFGPVPQFSYADFQGPTLADAQNEPGYAFARDQGLGALQASQAAKGILRTGGSLKDLIGFGNKFAEQNYGNVYDRAARTYNMNFQTAQAKYAPNLLGWQTKTAFGSNAAQRAWEQAWQNYYFNNVSANDAFQKGL
jgi:hypothetical protein